MTTAWCQTCRALMLDGKTCPECRRRRAWGVINDAIHELLPQRPSGVFEELEAVALLMQERQALIHQHRRDMRDEARAAQRDSRDSYIQGHDEGRREGRGDW